MARLLAKVNVQERVIHREWLGLELEVAKPPSAEPIKQNVETINDSIFGDL